MTLSEFKTVALSSAASFSLHKHKHNVAISRSRFASFPLIHLFDLSVFCCFLPSDLISGWQKGDIIIIIISRRDYRELFHGGGRITEAIKSYKRNFHAPEPHKSRNFIIARTKTAHYSRATVTVLYFIFPVGVF